MEERPTRWVYIEILTWALILLKLEESRSNTSEREVERAHRQGTRPAPLGACPPMVANQGTS